jgi:hypothetical protein
MILKIIIMDNLKTNFQSESKKSGDDFEYLVLMDLQKRGFTNIEENVYLEGTGCEVDFFAKGDTCEYVECKGGRDGDGKRPGAKRTDNVKKAIANGALIKQIYSYAKYVVYFSDTPVKKSYSDEMIRLALKYKIIDEVRYLSYND